MTTTKPAPRKRAPRKAAPKVAEVVPDINDDIDDGDYVDVPDVDDIPDELHFDAIAPEDVAREQVTIALNTPDGQRRVTITQPSDAFMALTVPRYFYENVPAHTAITGTFNILRHCLDDADADYLDRLISDADANVDPELPGKLVEFIIGRWTPDLARRFESRNGENRAARRRRR